MGEVLRINGPTPALTCSAEGAATLACSETNITPSKA